MLKYIKYMWIHVFKGWKLIEKWFVLMCKMWKLRYFGGCKAWTVIEALGTTGSQVTSLGSDSQKCVIVARRARGELRELAKWSGHVVPSSVQVQNQNLSFLTWFHMVSHGLTSPRLCHLWRCPKPKGCHGRMTQSMVKWCQSYGDLMDWEIDIMATRKFVI